MSFEIMSSLAGPGRVEREVVQLYLPKNQGSVCLLWKDALSLLVKSRLFQHLVDFFH